MTRNVYIKTMTWAGASAHYVGYQPSSPAAEPCHRLGSYFIATHSLSAARAIAQSEARRINGIVVECEPYVGL